jgi:hypothetical protein
MQHILEKYTLYTCCESAQSGPLILFFHPFTNENHNTHEINELMKFAMWTKLHSWMEMTFIHNYFVYVCEVHSILFYFLVRRKVGITFELWFHAKLH